MAAEGFWNDQEAAQAVIQKLKVAKGVVDDLGALERELTDLEELALIVEGDEEQEGQLMGELGRIEGLYEALELKSLFAGPHDHCAAMMTIQAGGGGTDANDFAEMLMRMYLRWAESEGLSTQTVEITGNDEAGIKNATIKFSGELAFGKLESEIGVHRLVRISPFNAAGKRQTSFVGVDILPELDDDSAIEILDKDLRIDTYRAGGKGGQHVNTSDSAVRITHIPTGVVVQCQNERSQHKNKAQAMKVLKARLARLKEMEREKEIASSYDAKGEINFGSQIRNYVLQPYTLVKDTRTKQENGNVQGVLDGNINGFIEAYRRWRQKKTSASKEK